MMHKKLIIVVGLLGSYMLTDAMSRQQATQQREINRLMRNPIKNESKIRRLINASSLKNKDKLLARLNQLTAKNKSRGPKKPVPVAKPAFVEEDVFALPVFEDEPVDVKEFEEVDEVTEVDEVSDDESEGLEGEEGEEEQKGLGQEPVRSPGHVATPTRQQPAGSSAGTAQRQSDRPWVDPRVVGAWDREVREQEEKERKAAGGLERDAAHWDEQLNRANAKLKVFLDRLDRSQYHSKAFRLAMNNAALKKDDKELANLLRALNQKTGLLLSRIKNNLGPLIAEANKQFSRDEEGYIFEDIMTPDNQQLLREVIKRNGLDFTSEAPTIE